MAGNPDRLPPQDYKAQQALEEARKAGTAPPAVDEDGNEINPHIPQYISQAPWYLTDSKQPGLKHQRRNEGGSRVGLDVWYKRGDATRGKRNKKWKAGCCTNCGASSHTKKDCFDRPRALGAQYTNKNIARDDVVVDLDLDYDSKRDRWNGYDPSMHTLEMKKFEAYEEARKKEKQRELASEKEKVDKEGDSSDSDSSDNEEKQQDEHAEYRESEDTAMRVNHRQTATFSVRTIVRDLRIREDTAKYLLNLDVNSAYFDPKTRSMRDDPFKDMDNSEERLYRGDNYVRHTGMANDFNDLQVFAWEAQEKGSGVHAQALPSQAEFMMKQFKKKKDNMKKDQQSAVLQRYGGEEHLKAPASQLLLGQSEQYVEYNRGGKVIKGLEKAVPTSKYEEDVFPSNHSSVWGSFWSNGKWGYACCGQTARNAYCLGRREGGSGSGQAGQEQERESNVFEGIVAAPNSTPKKRKVPEMSQEEKLKRAMEIEKFRKENPEFDERARRYHTGTGTTEVTPEEMEAYRLSKKSWEDPTAAP